MSRAYTYKRPLPPVEWLWEHFDYKPLTGEFVRKKTGRAVGWFNPRGYMVCGVYKMTVVMVHRLIYAWVTGSDPGLLDVDHKDLDPGNNRWGNLRLATRRQNCMNQRVKSTKANGLPKGVFPQPSGQRFYAAIATAPGQTLYLGTYDTVAEAAAAYCEAAKVHHGEFACV